MAESPGILALLKGRMQWHQARQKLLAENVANSDTPKFQPKDLVPYESTLGGAGQANLKRTQPMHMASIDDGGGNVPGQKASKFETAPSGNAVNLEDEMMKVSANQMEFQTAITLYQRSLGYIRTAVGRR
jgi:flagellar basal-body rod protein FlgB